MKDDLKIIKDIQINIITFKMQLTKVAVTFFNIYVHLFHPSAKKKILHLMFDDKSS